MAKRGANIDMGKHKPLGSSWRSMDTQAYSYAYQPESRPEFRCYVTGQAKAMADEYEAMLERKATLKVLDEVEALLKTL